MIAFLCGKLIGSSLEQIIIDVNGVGYRVYIPASILGRLPEVGKEVTVHTYFYVREDVMALYGFLEGKELELFEKLISVSGIGPKVAIGMISAISGANLIQAVIREDLKTLQNIPGIGKKTAQRIIIELKDKFAKAAAISDISAEMLIVDGSAPYSGAEDAIQALLTLGYSQGEARNAVDRVCSVKPELGEVESIIKLALKELLRAQL
ncbi:MAG: Holliday junction branch migration protein RuvA [Clostridia bacterium]|nr:Holliday junction branch migration protein RuvA [Clostridia bacterium]